MKIFKLFYLLIIISHLQSQNVDLYISLVEQGKLKGVRENLPELLSKYPKDSGVLFLKALLTVEGDSAINQYKAILKIILILSTLRNRL